MLKRIKDYRKLLIAIIAIIIIVLIVILVRCGSSETEKEDSGKNTQQEDMYDGEGLEIIPDAEDSKNNVDTSGYWDDEENGEDRDNQSHTQIKGDDSEGNQGEDNKSEENELEGNETEDDMSDEDVLRDEKTWGPIY